MIDTKANTFQSSSPLLGKVAGLLTFRIRSGEQSGRLIQLRALKCTIGSAPDCTLRIRASGVYAVHCLVMRGAGGVTVKAWAPQTYLNGRPFQDARLTPGDRLQIGPVELEWVEGSLPQTANDHLVHNSSSADQLVREITSRVKADFVRRQQRAWRKSALKKIGLANSKITQLKKRLRKTKQQVAEQAKECTRLQQAIQLAEQRAIPTNIHSPALSPVAAAETETNLVETHNATKLALELAQQDWEVEQQRWTALRAELEGALASKHAELEQRIQDLQAARDLQIATLRRCEEQEAARVTAEATRLSLWEQLQAEESRRTALEQLLSEKETAISDQIAAFEAAQAQLTKLTAQEIERQCALDFSHQARQTFEAQIRDGEEVRHDMERLLAEKSTELQQAHEELAVAQKSHSDLLQQSEELKRELTATRIIATSLEHQVAELSQIPPASNDDAEPLVSLHDKALAAHLEQVAELSRAVSAKEEELATLQQYLLSLQQSLTVAQESSFREQQRASELTVQLSETQQQRDLALQEVRQLQAQLQAAQNECATHTTELERREQELAKLQEAYQDQATALVSQNTQYEQLRVLAESRLTELTSTQQQLQQTIDTLQSELLEHKTQLAQAQQALLDSQMQLSQQVAQQDELQTSTQSRILTLEALVNHLEDELRTATSREENSEESLALQQLRLSADTEREQWMAQLQSLQQQLQAGQAEQDELLQQLNELRSQLTFSQQKVQERDQMIDQIRIEVKQQFEEWSAEREEFVNQLEAVRLETPVAMPSEPASTNSEALHVATEENVPEAEQTEETPGFWGALGASGIDRTEPNPAPQEPNLPETDVDQESLHGHAVSETFSAVMARLNAVGMIKMPHITAETPSLSPTPATSLLEPEPVEDEQVSVETELSHAETIIAPQKKIVEPAVPASFTPPSVSPPGNSFEAMKAKLLAEAAEEPESHPLNSPPVRATAPGELKSPNPEPVSNTTGSEPEHDSIEDYMAKLLKRVRGESVALAAHPSPQSVTPVEAPATVMENPQTEQQVIAPLADEEEYAPRGPAPEKNVDIGALRDIAVSSARQAIDLSSVRSRRQQALLIMVGVFCGTVAGSVLLVYAIKTETLWAAYTAFPCFGLGLYGMIQRVKLLKKSWE